MLFYAFEVILRKLDSRQPPRPREREEGRG
jgi:hypothetical protein